MKKHLARNLIIFIVWGLLIAGLVITYFNFKTTKSTEISNTNSIVALSIDKSAYNEGDEVITTVKTNEKAIAISFYLNYDGDTLAFKSTDDGVYVQDYPDQKLVRVMYFDLENKGRDTFNFKFKATKSSNNNLEISLTNTAVSTVSNNTYQQKDDEIKIGIKTDNDLLKTKNIIMISLVFAFVVVTIIFIISIIKSKNTTKGEKKDDKENNN